MRSTTLAAPAVAVGLTCIVMRTGDLPLLPINGDIFSTFRLRFTATEIENFAIEFVAGAHQMPGAVLIMSALAWIGITIYFGLCGVFT